MRSFNTTNMAEDRTYNRSQSNLNANQEHANRSDSLQQLNEELRHTSGSQSNVGGRTTRIADEMSQDLQYLSRDAPLDGGESTFGAYSTLGTTTPANQTITSSHIYSSSNSNVGQQELDDYERAADFRIEADDQEGGQEMRQEETEEALARTALQLRQQSSEQLEQLAPDNVDIQRPLQQAGFLVSFMVDARGGAMRGCRHSGVRVIIPPGAAPQPMRITCRYLRRERLVHPPPLMEGEACASKIMEIGPAGAKFLTPVLIEVPHFASLRGQEREIIILRSDSGEVWREHLIESDPKLIDEIIKSAEKVENSNKSEQQSNYYSDQENATTRPSSAMDEVLMTTSNVGSGGDSKKQQQQQQQEKRLTRIVTNEFPQYFAIISRIRQQVHTVGPEGSLVDSQTVPRVQAIFTDGALTKRIKIGLQRKQGEVMQDEEQEEGGDLSRAQSPASNLASERPSSTSGKRAKSRFLACFGASNKSRDPLEDDDLMNGGFASGSAESGDSTGGDSPQSKRSTSTQQYKELVVVPEDYYMERESPLILNLMPVTYGKRMASSWAQTEPTGRGTRLSTSASSKKSKRRGRRGNRVQMTIPLHEPTASQREQARAANIVQAAAVATQTGDSETNANNTNSSLESASGVGFDQLICEQPTSLSGGKNSPFNSSQNNNKTFELEDDLKCLTRTIQTDSDSVIVQYVTLFGQSGAAEAVEASSTVGDKSKSATGQDDGYVSGSGELKRTTNQEAKRNLFSPFCVARDQPDDSSIDDETSQSLRETKKAKKAKQTKKIKVKSGDKEAKEEEKKKRIEEENLKTSEANKSKAGTPVTLEAMELNNDKQQVETPELQSGGEEADESLMTSVTSRSTSPTSKEELKMKLKAEKVAKAERLRREKLEKQEEARADKARKKEEKEEAKRRSKMEKSSVNQDEESSSIESESKKSSLSKTIQSVKFAPSPIKSDKFGQEEEDDETKKKKKKLDDEQEVEAVAIDNQNKPEEGTKNEESGNGRAAPTYRLTQQVIDSITSITFKKKLPKFGSRSTSPPVEEEADQADEQQPQADESLVHLSIGDEHLNANEQPTSTTRDVSFEDEIQDNSLVASVSLSSNEPSKKLKPILKQQSSSASEGTESRVLANIADKLVSEVTEEAFRVATGQQPADDLHSISPKSSSESKKERNKSLKAEREQQKRQQKMKLDQEKRLGKELELLVKQAEVAAKRAEREAKKVTRQLAGEAEKQAKIACEQAELAVQEAERSFSSTTSQDEPRSLETSNSSSSELKRQARAAEVEAKRVAKEAELEAKRLAKEAQVEAKRQAKEAKRLAKEEAKKLKSLKLPSAPTVELIESTDQEQQQIDESMSQQQTESSISKSINKKTKHKNEKQKQDEDEDDKTSSSPAGVDTSSATGTEQTVSKSSGFLKRLFKSKPKVAVVETSGLEVAAQKEPNDSQLERDKRDTTIVSEMYPSDPNNADGEMILEVNVPENMISKQQHVEVPSSSLPAPPQELATTISSSTQLEPDTLEDQEATLVNMSQMLDDDEPDDDTENVLSQTTNLELTSEDFSAPQQQSFVVSYEPEEGQQQQQQEQQEQQRQISEHEEEKSANLDENQQLLSPAAQDKDQQRNQSLESVSSEGIETTQQVESKPLEVIEEVEADMTASEHKRKLSAKELKSEKNRKELEAKLEKEAKKQRLEEEKLAKRAAKEAKKAAEVEAKRLAKETKKREKREAREAKKLAELAKKEAKLAALAAKKNKNKNKVNEAEVSKKEKQDDTETHVTTSTAILTSSTTGPANASTSNDPTMDNDQTRVILSTSSEIPINEETEVERIVEEVLSDDGTVTKTTKLIETKYVTMRQEELRVAERRDIPRAEWVASEQTALGNVEQSTSTAPAEIVSAELEQIRAVPSFFDPEQLPSEIKPDLAPKKAEKKRVKLNQKLIKRALKLARSETKKAKVAQAKAEAEIAVCDEAARQARKELKRAIKEAKRAAKMATKEHKKMDKVDKKLAKGAKKIEKRQKKIDKQLAKNEKKMEKRREKELKKEAKRVKTEAKTAASRSPSRSSKKSIKLEDISEPILRSSSRLSIGERRQQQSQEREVPLAQPDEQQVDQVDRRQSASSEDVQLDLNVENAQSAAPICTQDQDEIANTISRTIETEHGSASHLESSERQMTNQEAADAAMRMELEASRDEDEEIDVVGLTTSGADEVEFEQNKENDGEEAHSTPDISQASSKSSPNKDGDASKKKKKRKNAKHKSRERAEL